MTRTRGFHRHGKTSHALYGVWAGMRQRCLDSSRPEYKNYGARGISICERWDNFECFLKDMGPRPSPSHSIDRIDNDGNYEPGNCRWATPKQQIQNRRMPARYRHPSSKLTIENVSDIKRALIVAHRGQAALARMFGVSVSTIKSIRRGLTWKHVPWPPRLGGVA